MFDDPYEYNQRLLLDEIDQQEEQIDWEIINRADEGYVKLIDVSHDLMASIERPVIAQAIHELRIYKIGIGEDPEPTTEEIKDKAREIALRRRRLGSENEYSSSSVDGSGAGRIQSASNPFLPPSGLHSNTTLAPDDDLLLDDATEPFQLYIESDKSIYAKASDTINPKTKRKYIDPHDFFLVDSNGAFLLNIDFKFVDTHLLRKAARTYKKTGKYTNYKRNSVPYNSLRKKEEHRRKKGFTAKCRKNKDGSVTDLYITGEYYNFLNYGRIQKVDIDSLKLNVDAEAKKYFDFPDFIDFQFWYTTVKGFARANGFNIITLKARRKGASFMEAIDSANELNCNPGKVVIHAAGEKKFLTAAGAISNMSYRQLVFYETYTPFTRGGINKLGMPSGLLSNNLDELELGYKLKNGTKAGWLSTLFTVSTKNNPGAAVGKDASKIKCDELNDFPNFSPFMGVTNPTTTTGAFKTGIISAFGTGGAKAGNWAEFESNYFETKKYDFMPFSNVFDKDSQAEVIGLFLPYWWGLQGVTFDGRWTLDKDGNTDYNVAIEISRNERADKKLKAGIGRDYIMFCSQFANRPSEAFNSGTETMLTSLELKNHIKNVKLDTSHHFYRDGMLVDETEGLTFRSNEWLKNNGHTIHPYITKVPFNSSEDFHGCIREYHRPYTIDNRVPKKLYFITYDPVGADIIESEIQDRHSLAAIQVWMASNSIANSEGKILVATWVGRLDTQLDIDKIVFKLSDYYNADILGEMDRGNLKANAKKENKLHRLLPDPTEVILNRNVKSGGQRSYGMILGSSARKIDGIDHLKDFLYEAVSTTASGQILRRFHYIKDLPLLEEIDKFRFNGNFDRVSAMILAMFQFNMNTALKRKPKSKAANKKSLESLMLKRKRR